MEKVRPPRGLGRAPPRARSVCKFTRRSAISGDAARPTANGERDAICAVGNTARPDGCIRQATTKSPSDLHRHRWKQLKPSSWLVRVCVQNEKGRPGRAPSTCRPAPVPVSNPSGPYVPQDAARNTNAYTSALILFKLCFKVSNTSRVIHIGAFIRNAPICTIVRNLNSLLSC
ncbi:hypothetical protein EVAR_56961_1 [Eumeta japonica]|uniref:Uncharacterized protein n=1 Tax=Eumeta variegata TaxID=151549 RepID=A0A4C1YSB1_EUMVA|nr:hypothetical protein EVAR_56961_1 [Eumeta japonica]